MVANPEKDKVAKDEKFNIRLSVELPAPWHTYPTNEQLSSEGIGPSPTEFNFLPDNALKIDGKIKSSKPKTEYDKGFEFDIQLFEGKFEFTIPVVAKKDIDFATDKIQLLAYMQLCDTSRCLPGDDYKTTITADAWGKTDVADAAEMVEAPETSEAIVPAPDALNQQIASAEQPVKTESQMEIEQKKSEGFLSFLLFAMGAGALALLTPCVFPMIPITVSFFTKRSEKGKGGTVRDASVYALGIILTFTGLGILLAGIFGATGIRDFASNGWVNIFIAAIFVIFALNLFGSFEIQLPTGLMNKLNKKSGQSNGVISVLLMALTFSITSFTCTVPFVGSTLIAASGGEWFWAVLGMVGFSGIFALPFFLLALFPSFMKKMPKAGGWMNNVKVVMGFIEIAAAMKFLSNADLVWNWGILSKEWFLAIWIAICIIVSLYILGVFRLHHDSEVKGVTASRIIFSVFFMAVAFYFITGMFGKTLGELDAFLPPTEYRELMNAGELDPSTASAVAPATSASESGSGYESMVWLSDYEAALKQSKESGVPLFIDFTGFTCTNCRWMEQNMFKREEIYSRMNQFVKVHLYTDRRTEPYLTNKKMQQEQYGSIELPLYVIIAPDGSHVGTKTFTRNMQEFVDFLDRGIATTVR
jgi:thiol:disulfide interchange protein DsbD